MIGLLCFMLGAAAFAGLVIWPVKDFKGWLLFILGLCLGYLI